MRPCCGYHPAAAGAHSVFLAAALLLVSPTPTSGRQPTTSPAIAAHPLSSFQNTLSSLAIPTTATITRFFAAFSTAATTATFTEAITGSGQGGGALAACVPGESGTWVLPGTGCTTYYRCGAGRRPLEIRNCPAGKVFFTQYLDCLPPTPSWRCWEPVCAGRVDGLYPDLTTGCRRSVRCQGSRVVAAIGCPTGHLSAGRSGCRPANQVSCPRVSEGAAPVPASSVLRGPPAPGPAASLGPASHPACLGRSPSLAQDRSASSRCRQYFRCSASGQRTLESCPASQVFDGSRCVDADRYVCPSNPNSPCDRLPDGVHIQPGSRCRSYIRCSLGYKSVYVCSGDSVFDGERCVSPGQAVCSEQDPTPPSPSPAPPDPSLCSGKSHGYFADFHSGCRRYVYCLSGARVASFTCEGGRRFDGTACVDAAYCPAGTQYTQHYNHLLQHAQRTQYSQYSQRAQHSQPQHSQQGFVQDLQSGCHNYSFFIAGRETRLSCPAGLLFNGQLCVSESTYTCPTG